MLTLPTIVMKKNTSNQYHKMFMFINLRFAE